MRSGERWRVKREGTARRESEIKEPSEEGAERWRIKRGGRWTRSRKKGCREKRECEEKRRGYRLRRKTVS